MLKKTHKHRKTMSWQSKSAAVAIAIMAMSLHSSSVQAMPEQGKVVAGQGEIARPDDKTMVINQKTDRLALDWQKFNIAKDEKVHFDQNSKSAIAINRVVGDGRSIIDGSLSATGNVFVINPNGVLFGKNSSVDVGGLVASTANVTDDDLKNFTQGKGDLGLQIAAGREASVINAGTIKAEGGLVALHATTVENTGTITNEGGTTALASAKNLNIAADTAGKLNFTVNGSLANAKALNSGTLQSDGGYIVMTAKSAGDVMSTVVNNTGIIEAKTLHTNDKGEILLDGGESGQVEVSGTLNASGMEAGQSAGSIKVIGAKTIVNDGTNLLARGTIDGGKIETSGDVLDLGNNLNIDASGDTGSHGTWLLDPLEVIISASKQTGADHEYGTIVGDTTGTTKNNVIFNDPPSGQNANNAYNSTTWIDSDQVGRILSKGTDVIIQAISTSGAASITLDSPIDITVSTSAIKNPTLTLDATRNITINQNITAESAGKGLNVMFNADTDGDGMGAVIINADITTNGGDFTSITGGKVTHTSKGTAGAYDQVNVGGAPAREKLGDSSYNPATVGTYFGTSGTSSAAEPRSINTGGGNITLNGEVAIGLNGGTLTLDTGGGALTVTGLINSGNSYKAYIYGTDDWNNNKMIQDMVDEYLANGTVPAYHYIGITYDRDANGNLVKDGDGYKWSYTAKNYPNTGAAGNIHYVLKALSDTSDSAGGKDFSTINPQWYTTTDAGYGYDAFIVDKASTITVDEYLAYVKKSAPVNWTKKYNASTFDAIKNDPEKMATLKSDIAELIAHNWFLAEQIAENGTQGGANVGDSYLATITTRLENSLSTPNGQHTLWVGGRGSGVRGRTVDVDKNNPATWGPSDPTLMDGFYWVTGPEGTTSTYTGSDGKTLKYDAGTKFWDTVSSDWGSGKNGEPSYGFNPTWSTYKSGSKTITQPDNNGPFLTVGYGSDNQWDDANFGGETTWGFVQETNLANSNLVINAGGGDVNLKGDVGKAKALDTLKIANAGEIKFGDTSNKVTSYNNGTVYVDHGLYISGNKVTVGGEIHSGESEETDTSTTLEDKDNITILSAGDIEVHGITSHTYDVANDDGTTTTRGGKISLTSTGDSGKITLGAGVDYDGNATAGTITADSSDKGAVVIDAQGKTGAFINKTTGDKAIDTKGTWQVYVASPSDYGTILGDNLNSETNAQWSSESTNKYDTNAADKSIHSYTNNTSNKFIFQVTPTITVSGQNMTKVYGDTLSDDDLRNKLTITSATFKDSDGTTTHSVDDYTDNFKEASDKAAYIASTADTTSTGLKNISVSSDAQDATATRTGGYKESSTDSKKAIYLFNVGKENATGLNGYALDTKNADIEITKRTASITGTGTQTYGGEKGKFDWKEETKTNIADGSTVSYTTSIKPGSDYTNKQGDRNTADHGSYNDSVSFDNLKIIDSKGNDVNIADNYDLTTTGTIDVAKAKLIVNTDGKTTTYGTVDEDYKTALDNTTPALNGDKAENLLEQLGLTYTTEAYSDSNGDGTNDKTNHVKYTSDSRYDSYALDVANTNTLNNYDVTVNDSTVTITPAQLYIDTAGNTKVYGDVKGVTEDINKAPSIQGGESALKNGDSLTDILDQLQLGATSDALVENGTRTNHVTAGGYDINPTYQQLNDYTVSNGVIGKEILTKAKATVKTDNITTDYGTVDTNYQSSFSGQVNGDDPQDLLNKLNLSYKTDAYKDATHTADVRDGGYLLDVTKNADLQDYETDVQDATVTLNKKKITVTNEMTQTYGDPTQTFRAVVTPPLVNDDQLDLSKFKVSVKEGDTPYQKNRNGRTTADVGEYADSLTYEGGGIVHADGSDSYKNYDIQEIDSKIIVNPASLIVKTGDVTIDYGTDYATTVGKTGSSVEGLRNGDENHADDLAYAYGNYGKDDRYGYLDIDGGKRTNNIGDYGFTTSVSNKSRDFLKNYTISGGDAKLTINPKDVYFHVDGNGNTLADIVYTATNPNDTSSPDPINGQLVYGETVTPSYRPDGMLPNGHYGVSTSIDGKTITDNDVYGNYRYHYDGDVTVDMPNKPDFPPPVNPPVTPGRGTVTPLPEQPMNPSSNTPENTTETTGHKTVWDGEHDRGGDRPEDKRVVTLPFFKVLEDKTTHRYGTYDVTKRTTEVKIEPSAQVLPEPNQPATQYRELTTEFTTDKGTGEFTLKYNGSRFTILPDDDAAMKLIVVGDETKNRDLFEKALHVAFTQMGLEVADLDGVYIHFGKE